MGRRIVLIQKRELEITNDMIRTSSGMYSRLSQRCGDVVWAAPALLPGSPATKPKR